MIEKLLILLWRFTDFIDLVEEYTDFIDLVDEFDGEFSVQRPGFSMAGDCLVVWVCGGVISGCEIGWESEENNNIFIRVKKQILRLM